ncbi:hypothetical protein [Nocardioides nanhaiensis]|uniref:Uncharacterized protein n=1 Tax=Nocardioides nanhaiensis TaxID=1476871 RepID=A0ABP8VYN9_9ACTN
MTAPSRHRSLPARALLCGLVGLAACAGYAWVWIASSDYECGDTGVLACMEYWVVAMVVATPTTYVLWSLAFRALGTRWPWLAPIGVFAGLFALAAPLGSLDPPLAVWLAVCGVLSALWALLPARAGAGPRRGVEVSG